MQNWERGISMAARTRYRPVLEERIDLSKIDETWKVGALHARRPGSVLLYSNLKLEILGIGIDRR